VIEFADVWIEIGWGAKWTTYTLQKRKLATEFILTLRGSEYHAILINWEQSSKLVEHKATRRDRVFLTRVLAIRPFLCAQATPTRTSFIRGVYLSPFDIQIQPEFTSEEGARATANTPGCVCHPRPHQWIDKSVWNIIHEGQELKYTWTYGFDKINTLLLGCSRGSYSSKGFWAGGPTGDGNLERTERKNSLI